jgi:hypothetical protein
MQQPIYFAPNRSQVLSGPSPVSLADDPGETDTKQADHALRLRELKQAYPEAVNRCRTLDEYIHESIDEPNANFRNGDQVVSHYIERIRRDTRTQATQDHRDEEPLGTASAEGRQTGREDNGAVDADKDGKGEEILFRGDFGAPFRGAVKADTEGSEPHTGGAEKARKENITPSRLESQTVGHESVLRHIQHIIKGRSERRQHAPRTEHPSHYADDDIDDQDDEDGQKSEASDDVEEIEPEPVVKSIRQQILTVPQLWLWVVGGKIRPHMIVPQAPTILTRTDHVSDTDTVVTAFPENWRATDRYLLPQSFLSTLVPGPSPHIIESVDAEVDAMVRDIVTETLDLEATLSSFDGSRSYLDVFAAEIAFVVGLVRQLNLITGSLTQRTVQRSNQMLRELQDGPRQRRQDFFGRNQRRDRTARPDRRHPRRDFHDQTRASRPGPCLCGLENPPQYERDGLAGENER